MMDKIYKSNDISSRYVSKHNQKIKINRKMKRFFTRYMFPVVIMLLSIIISIFLDIFVGYNFDTKKYDVAKTFLLFPIFLLVFGFFGYNVSLLWLKFVTKYEDKGEDNYGNSNI